jgi:hypothetical protein
MSSFIRRIQRTQHPSKAVHYPKGADGKPDFSETPYANPPRKVFFKGRGSKLGVHNPKAKDLIARQKREAKRATLKGS